MEKIIQRLIRSPEQYDKPAVWINIDTATGEIVDDAHGRGYQNKYRARKGYHYHHLHNSQSKLWWQQYPKFEQACIQLNHEINDKFNFKMFWKIIKSVDTVKAPTDDINWNDVFNYIKEQ